MKSGVFEFEPYKYGADDIYDTKLCSKWEEKCRRLERNRVGVNGINGLDFKLSVKMVTEEKISVSYMNLPKKYNGRAVNHESLFNLIKECVSYAYALYLGFAIPGYIENTDDFTHYASIFHKRVLENMDEFLNTLCQCGLDSFVMAILQFIRIMKLSYELDKVTFTSDTYQWKMTDSNQYWNGNSWTGDGYCIYVCDDVMWSKILKDCTCKEIVSFSEASKFLVKGYTRIREMKFILNNINFDSASKCFFIPENNYWNGKIFSDVRTKSLLSETEIWEELLGKVKNDSSVSPVEEVSYRI